VSIGQTVIDKLKAAFPDAKMELRDTTGTDDHWELAIASNAFTGINRVKQHQAIYKPLRELIDSNQVHALKITTFTLDQWENR
jgi:stress-induced morphogen